MSLLNNTDAMYSLMAKLFHWLTLPVVLFLFALGLWMTDLDYYDPWYKKGPNIHMGVGVLLAIFTTLRVIYRLGSTYPKPLEAHKHVQLAAKLVHIGLYVLLFSLFITGYVIVTIEGTPLSVFGLFDIPPILHMKGDLQDAIGEVHEVFAFLLIGLAFGHGGAALWHHFKLRDNTLLRMVTKAK